MIDSMTEGRDNIDKSEDFDLTVQPKNKDGFSTESDPHRPESDGVGIDMGDLRKLYHQKHKMTSDKTFLEFMEEVSAIVEERISSNQKTDS